ncbi:MAG: sigma-70 family RNA polymerase sigma factor, partial [Chloroflexi bacterium]|nr:sigma-70 family RNA polymerase sigma factor [Chloroflexota bacterium]
MPAPPIEMSEEQLIQRAQRGDAEAFGELYQQHLAAIYRYVFYRLGNVAEAEDLTETVFLKAWEALDHYRRRDVPFSAWLYRIAHNAIIDRYRRDHETLALDEQTDLCDEADGPEDYLAETETTEVLIKALAQLSTDHQQVLVLRFINGLNHADTSRVLGRSEEAVRVLQHRALKALRACLMRRALP